MPNSSSILNRFSFGLLLLVVEVICLYFVLSLLFNGIATLTGNSIVIFPLFFLVIGGFSLITNLILQLHGHRLLTYLVINLSLGGLGSWFVLVRIFKDPVLFPDWASLVLNDGFFVLLNWITLFGCIWIWRRGFLWAKKTLDYQAGIVHFEMTTMLMLFTLFIAELTISIPKGGLWAVVGLIANLSILALIQPDMEKGPKLLIGPLVLTLIFLPFYFLTAWLLPGLAGSAAVLIQATQPIFKFFGDIILFVLLKFLNFNPMVPQVSPSENSNSISAIVNGASSLPPWINTLLKIIIWGLLGLIFLLVLVGLGYVFYKLILRLLKKQEPNGLKNPIFSKKLLSSYIQRFIFWLRMLVPWKALLRPQQLDALLAYQALMRWGARKRVPKYLHETPYEYYFRLSQQFPDYTSDLRLITECYVKESYGSRSSTPLSIKPIYSAVRNLYRLFPR